MARLLLGVLLALVVFQAAAGEWRDHPAISQLFEEAGVEGTIVLYDAQSQLFIGHDRARAETRYVPASTFKVPHTLIGLATGVVEGVDEILPFGGAPQPFSVWESDMSLRDAIVVSNVPVYQGLARKIGSEGMRDRLRSAGYGNGDIGTVVDRFWLDGPLAISAMEQARFMARLAAGALPFDPDHQAAVREIVLLEENGDRALHGKTGWQNAPSPGTGWWTGWVRSGDSLYGFALNMDILDPSDAAMRLELGKASLRAAGVY
ncbi:MAG: class D beta-lactamase [Ectothiorhodospiraceae bacterium]|nr:class D beta-lactamase [Ectothiorhodospiraceae bacterium]